MSIPGSTAEQQVNAGQGAAPSQQHAGRSTNTRARTRRCAQATCDPKSKEACSKHLYPSAGLLEAAAHPLQHVTARRRRRSRRPWPVTVLLDPPEPLQGALLSHLQPSGQPASRPTAVWADLRFAWTNGSPFRLNQLVRLDERGQNRSSWTDQTSRTNVARHPAVERVAPGTFRKLLSI